MNPASLRSDLEAAFGLIRRGRHQDAIALCTRILVQHPDQADALHLMGVANMEGGKSGEAVEVLERAVASRPGDPEILGNLGVTYFALNRNQEAAETLSLAVEKNPANPDLHTNLGAALRAAGRLTESETSLNRALELRPDHVPALFNLANTCLSLDRLDQAHELYNKVIALSPNHAGAFGGLGFIYKQQGSHEQSIDALERYPAGAPGNESIRSQLGHTQLMLGRFSEGWRNYLSRENVVSPPTDLRRKPLCQDLSGKRILVCRDQGLGDEIFFARFMPQLSARGAEFSYWADPRLVSLFQRAGIASCVDGGETNDAFDFSISIGDLPYLLAMESREQIPPSIRLAALPDRVTALTHRLHAFGPPPYVGVTWRAGTSDTRFLLYKEAPMARLAALLAPLDARIIVVQRGPEKAELAAFSAALGRPACDLSALNADLEDILALVGLLDDYVCVSNTNVHLRAAQEGICRLLVPNPPEYRWMAAGAESPWFPGFPVYRQGTDGDWTTAFDALERDLKAALNGRAG